MSAHIVDVDGDRLPGIEFALPGEVIPTAVESADEALPSSPALVGNFPNPFNPTTHIRFAVTDPGLVTLSIYNATGQRIRVLVEGDLAPGFHQVLWDGRDASGANAASGVYFVRMLTSGFTGLHAIALMR